MGADPIVSVCLITYNHVSFIRDAIEGVLSQKVNFPWEFIIADDFSVDGARDIVVEYQKKYPELIRLILQEKNVGAANNWFDLMKAPKGKYIAYFEGDDYWIDDHKLQKQVDFLEKNEKYVGCSSNVYEKNGLELIERVHKTDKFTFGDLVFGNPLHTCSVMYRNIISTPGWLAECKMGDWIIWLLLAKHGPIYNFDEKMAIYRMHMKGLWIGKGREQNLKDIILTYDVLLKNFDPQLRTKLKKGAAQYYDQLLNILSEKKSREIFYWSNKAFFFDHDTRRGKFLIKYFRNILLMKRAESSPVSW